MKKQASNISFSLGIGLLTFIFLVVSLTSLAFFAGGGVSIAWPIASFIAAGAITYHQLAKHNVVKRNYWMLAFAIVIVASIMFATSSLDTSYDGNSYHKTAIGALKNGWNPLKQGLNNFNVSGDNPQQLRGGKNYDRGNDALWSDHYPKMTWLFASSIYKMTGNIESGKAITPLVAVTTFLFAFSLIGRKLDRNKTIMLSALLALNPVIVTQIYSYYNDGILGNLVIMLLILLSILVLNRSETKLREQYIVYAAIFMVLALAINVKFTGLAYAGITTACYFFFFLIYKKWSTVKALATTGIAALIFGILVIGSTSYVENTVTNRNPLFPLAGEGKVDIITENQPLSYADKPGLHKFFEANLSPTSNIGYQGSLMYGDTKPKTPFTISIDELHTLSSKYPDIRQAGYGVWFGGILLLTTAIGILILIRYRKDLSPRSMAVFILPTLSVLIIIVAFDTSWWARYLPQLYIVPVLVVIALFIKRIQVVPYVILFALFFNITIIAALTQSQQSKWKVAADASLQDKLPCNSGQPALVFSGGLDGTIYNIWDKCSNIILISPEQYNNTPQEEIRELYNGTYLISR